MTPAALIHGHHVITNPGGTQAISQKISQRVVATDHQAIRVGEALPIAARSGSEQVNGPEGWVGLLRGKSLTQLLLEGSEPVPVALIAQLLQRAD